MEPTSMRKRLSQTPVTTVRHSWPLSKAHSAGLSPPAVDDDHEPASPRNRAESPGAPIARQGRRLGISTAGVVVALVALVVGAHYYIAARSHETTDDAFVGGSIVHVAPQVAGQVVQVLVTDDQPVQAGDLLVELDPGDFAVRLVQATAAAAEAHGRLEQASWQLLVAGAERTLAEAEVIAAQARGENTAAVQTATEFELTIAQLKEAAAVAQVNLADAQLETAAAGVLTAEAALEQARRQLASTEIRAPRPGRVRMKSVEPGEYVQVGQELLALVSDDLEGPATFRQ
jgi:membrane fusion protein (multidrug efflux system)